MRDFLWSDHEDNRKVHVVSWQHLCLPIEEGVLGVRSIKDVNIVLLCKWLWRIGSDEEAS